MTRILVVDGNSTDREWVAEHLKAAGHEVACVADATTAVEFLEHGAIDMAILDWMLRDMSGLELASFLRKHANGRLGRVLILSDQADAVMIASALDSGVDDYLTKPVRAEELLARVHAALRRPAASALENVLQVGPVRLDKLGHKVTVGPNELELELAPAEYRLMAYFMENQGRVLARRHLLDQVWRRRSGIGERTVDVHVRRLRAALEPHSCENLLQTVRGFGYRFG